MFRYFPFIILILGLDRPIKDLAIKEKKQIKNDLSGKDIEGRQKLTLMSDQERISPYHINTTSSIEVMRTKKNINSGIMSWSNAKFSKLT